jgi:hypothetical protein
VPAETVLRVRDAFMALGETAEGRALLGKIPMTRPTPTDARDYRPIEILNLEEFFVPAGGELAAEGEG